MNLLSTIKPFYIQGPSDPPARAERILRALEAQCGEGGYHYIVAADDFEPLDDAEESGPRAITGPLGRAGLEAMAARMQASEPGIEVRIRANAERNFQMAEAKWSVCKEEAKVNVHRPWPCASETADRPLRCHHFVNLFRHLL